MDWRTDKTYQAQRNIFLLSNEHFRMITYFDVVGVPTISEGVSIVARSKGSTDEERKFCVNKVNLRAIEEIVNDKKFQEFEDFAKEAVEAINNTPEPKYIGKTTPGSFEATTRGMKIQEKFGHINKRWEVISSPKLTKEEAEMIAQKVIEVEEIKLDSRLDHVKINSATLTINQRIILLDASYQGRWLIGGRQAALQMKIGASVSDVCKALRNVSAYSKYKNRIDKGCRLLDPNYHPSELKPSSKQNLKPQARARDPVRKEMRHGVAVHTWIEEFKANSLFKKIIMTY